MCQLIGKIAMYRIDEETKGKLVEDGYVDFRARLKPINAINKKKKICKIASPPAKFQEKNRCSLKHGRHYHSCYGLFLIAPYRAELALFSRSDQ